MSDGNSLSESRDVPIVTGLRDLEDSVAQFKKIAESTSQYVKDNAFKATLITGLVGTIAGWMVASRISKKSEAIHE